MLPDTAIKEGRGFLTDVLKQAGINGLLLLLLCGLVAWSTWKADKNAERREERFFVALKTVSDSLYSIQGRSISALTTSSEVLRTANQVMADNTRVMSRLSRRQPGERDGG